MRMVTGLMAALAAVGAANGALGMPQAAERIVYETGPCFGFFPVYQVTVTANGRGVFEGQRFTAVKGRRSFRLTRAQFTAFRGALQADRPAGVRRLKGKTCRVMATDQITVDVRWTGGVRAPSQLHAYFGCDMDANAALFRRLAAAPAALPIAAFIGDGAQPK